MNTGRSLRSLVAQGVGSAGAIVALTWPLPYSVLRWHLVPVDEPTVVVMRFVLTRWVFPSALCLLVAGYLLQPRRRPYLRTRLYPVVRVGVTFVLWTVGLFFLLTPVGLAIWEGVRLVASATSTMVPWRPAVLATYAVNLPFFPTGVLFLLAARKWVVETGVVV
ncbi:MAG: hypothetical protein Q9O62_14170 [Ardenticatenia bacterium]|nr:hypothetical protein [Ardenticatenia bacterium]